MSEYIPFGIREAAEDIERRKREQETQRTKEAAEAAVREGFIEAVNEFNTVPYWRQTGLDKRDIEDVMQRALDIDEQALAFGEIERIIVPFVKEDDGYGRSLLDEMLGRGRSNERGYRLIQDL